MPKECTLLVNAVACRELTVFFNNLCAFLLFLQYVHSCTSTTQNSKFDSNPMTRRKKKLQLNEKKKTVQKKRKDNATNENRGKT